MTAEINSDNAEREDRIDKRGERWQDRDINSDNKRERERWLASKINSYNKRVTEVKNDRKKKRTWRHQNVEEKCRKSLKLSRKLKVKI